MHFPDMLERFSRYTALDTQSSESSPTLPSTEKQLVLSRLLCEELKALGLSEVELTDKGYVLATLPTNQTHTVPTMAWIAHVDTSPDVSGEGVVIRQHPDYQGQDLVLDEEGNVVLSPSTSPLLKDKIGNTILTASGNTLLGADDKAGITEIMCALRHLSEHPELPRPRIRILFTPDEEVGRGTEGITAEQIRADFGYTVDGEKLGEIEDENFYADSV